MIGAKPAAKDNAATSPASPPPFLDYFPRWRWALLSLGFGMILRDTVQTVADAGYRRGLVVGRRHQLIIAVVPDDPDQVGPYCEATGAPGCQRAGEDPGSGCGLDQPCYWTLPAHNAD